MSKTDETASMGEIKIPDLNPHLSLMAAFLLDLHEYLKVLEKEELPIEKPKFSRMANLASRPPENDDGDAS